MKIKHLVFFFFLSLIGYSQAVTVNYSEKRIISKEKLEATPEFARKHILASYNYTLKYQNGISLYENSSQTKNTENSVNEIANETNDGGGVHKNTATYRITDKTKEKYYYKDIAGNELLFKFFNGNKDFFGKDHLLNWNWQITNETKEMNGFTCKKATSDAFGYFFTAWFTEDIAISAGPEKFDGLPGLILYLSTGGIEFVATSVKIDENPIIIVKPETPKETVTMAEVESFVKEKVSKLKSSSTTTVNGNTTTTRSTIIIK
ncbi:GLPGLI family protein [Flavobacterium sp. TMP13]|uniref:GLPGLI family protein n=1 Tax=Flavobacterium sp. TMP13 TaxID=3425950 RepID=UPI003D7875B1